MNRTWLKAATLVMALGLIAGTPGECSVANAQAPPERALRPLRSTQSPPGWTAPQTRVARTYRPWVDPTQRAQMQRSSHASQVMPHGEMVEPGVMDGGAMPHGGQPGHVMEQGESPVVNGFHSGQEMSGGDYGCTNGGDCGGGEYGGCGCGDGGCDGGCGFDGGCCNGGCDADCGLGRKICLCIDLCWFKDLQVSGGVHAFQSPGFPIDTLQLGGGNGNFGFQEGLNLGAPLPCFGHNMGIGFQVGFQGTQSNLYDQNPLFLKQQFFTAGLFHRSLCGLQGGIVWDYVRNEYLRTTNFDHAQVRGEVSFIGPRQNEIGFMCNLGTSGLTNARHPLFGAFPTYVSDFYGAFIRRRSCTGGDFRAFVGGTDTGFPIDAQGNRDNSGRFVMGADFHVPLGSCVALDTGFTYLMPMRSNSQFGEGWNIGMNLVWYPFKSRCCPKDPCWGEMSQFRPLFNVADNGSMFIRQ